MNWHNIDYLKTGNRKQRQSYEAIVESNVLEILKDYFPVVVSTICVGLDIDKSDIDIICQADSISCFEEIIISNYSHEKNFKSRYRGLYHDEFVCSFSVQEFEIEIYASTIPVEKQNAYRHLTVMKRLIDVGGETFCDKIRQLKKKGLKTEPSIVKLLNLPGNPYIAVLTLENYTIDELTALLKQSLKRSNKCI